jgi:mitogen-activated protein kinase organizer 1
LSVNSNTNGDVPVENLPRALPIQTYDDNIRYTPTAMDINDDSTRILVASDKTAILLDGITKTMLRKFHTHTAVINSVAMFSSTNLDQVYATASYDATVCLWDARSSNSYRPIQVLKDAKDSVTVVAVSSSSSSSSSSSLSNDATIRTASVDGMVRTYDIRKGIMECDHYNSPIISMACKHQDSMLTLAVSCLDGTIRITNDSLWKQSDGIATPPTVVPPTVCRQGHIAGQYALECCFLSNGLGVLTGSENGSAILYETCSVVNRKRKKMSDDLPYTVAPIRREYLGHTAPTCSVVAHPNRNDVIITASYDGTCVVWASHNEDYFQ